MQKMFIILGLLLSIQKFLKYSKPYTKLRNIKKFIFPAPLCLVGMA